MDILQNGREWTVTTYKLAVVAFHLTAAQSLSGKILGQGEFCHCSDASFAGITTRAELLFCNQSSKRIVKHITFKKLILNARKSACSCCYVLWIGFI